MKVQPASFLPEHVWLAWKKASSNCLQKSFFLEIRDFGHCIGLVSFTLVITLYYLHLYVEAGDGIHLKKSIKVFHLPGVNGEIPPMESRARWSTFLHGLALFNAFDGS